MERTTVQAVIDSRLGTFAQAKNGGYWIDSILFGVKTSDKAELSREEQKFVLETLLEEEGE